MHQEITLSNGARLLLEEVPGVRSAALGFFVGVGSRHERAEENGASHFIEHMLFKGTHTRSALQIARDADAIGGQLNAYTTKEYTCFHIRTLDSHLDRGLDLLADMLFDSRFDQRDMEMERGVILGEIDMYEDTPDDLVSERLAAAVYQGTPLARAVLGKASTLENMDGAWLHSWQKEHYHGGVLAVSLAGSFSKAQAERLARILERLPGGAVHQTQPAVYHPAVTVKQKAIEQNHLILACPAPSYLDPRQPQMQLLNALLGGGCSSRLFQELREKQGLCYAVYSYVSSHAETGLLGIYTAVSPEQERQALETIRQITTQLAEHGPTQEEVERVRDLAKANLLMGDESVQIRMSNVGVYALLHNKRWDTREMMERYDAVTREQLRDLAAELFRPEDAALSAVGRVGEAAEYAAWLGGQAKPFE